MSAIWLPMWQCSSTSLLCWPLASSSLTMRMSSATFRPNFEFVPDDSAQRPAPRVARRTRTPSCDM